MPRAGVDRRSRLLVGRPAVADRDTMAMLHEITHELDAPRQLRRKGNNPNGAPMVGDDAKYVGACKGTLRLRFLGYLEFLGFLGSAQARRRLCAVPLWIDEIAFKVRAVHLRGSRSGVLARAVHSFEKSIQPFRRAR